MLRIDLDEKEIRASVLDVVTEPLDVPRSAGVLAGARAMLGTDVHRAWRLEREASGAAFAAEVVVSCELEVDGFAVRIRGRADGVLEEEGGVVVEEVKSVETTVTALRDTTLSDHADACLQVRLYALFLARARPGIEVRARLVLISIVDGSRRALDVPFDPDTAERVLVRRLRERIAVAEAARVAAWHRTEVAAALCFPYAEQRPYQAEFSDAVAQGLEAGRPVLATAPTGVGKTIGALLPALRFALSRDALLFFLTSRTTQQALVARTFEDLARACGRPAGDLKALTFREKRRMCPPGNLLCHPDPCPFLAGFLQRRAREAALDDLLDGAVHIDPDAILALGKARTICPYALALALCLRVDLVIGDTNYVYDPAVSLGLFAQGAQARAVVVVVDEAHSLFDRAREYYSPFLRRSSVTDLRDRALGGDFLAPGERGKAPALRGLGVPLDGTRLFAGIAEYLAHVVAVIDGVVRGAVEEYPAAIQGCRLVCEVARVWDDAAADAATWMVRYAHYQHAHGLVRADDPLIECLCTVMAIRDLLRLQEPEFVPYAAEGPDAPEGAGFGILCVNPARRLEERHRQVLGTVAMSATLEPLGYYADVLGLRSLEPIRLSLPSPFPVERRCVMILPTVSTTWRERRRHYDAIARAIEGVVAVRPGNYVAYFPSFRFLEDVRKKLEIDESSLLVQEPRTAPAERVRLLDRLRAEAAPTLLLAVMGGVFAEGIDLPGEALVGAIVVGPGLPQVGFERAAIQHYFDEKAEAGFAYAMLFPGMQRVIQAAGRVHRTPIDKGVIVLLGRRFARPPYVDCLPSHWSCHGPEDLVTMDPVARLRAFWASVGERA